MKYGIAETLLMNLSNLPTILGVIIIILVVVLLDRHSKKKKEREDTQREIAELKARLDQQQKVNTEATSADDAEKGSQQR